MAGNRTAQKQLYEKYSRLFFALCFRFMPTRAEAEDVMIVGFMSIFENIQTYKYEGSFEGWMRKIMVNTAISTMRTNGEHYFQQETEETMYQAEVATAQNFTYSHVAVKEIMKQIQQLSDGCRTVFNLHAIEGYSYEEIAEMLNINMGTVKSQLARARKTLQDKLKAYR